MSIENLVKNLESRKSELFVTTDVKKQLKMLVNSGDINEAKFFDVRISMKPAWNMSTNGSSSI